MANPKLSKFLVAMVVVSMFATIFSLYFADLQNGLGTPDGNYSSTSLQAFETLDQVGTLSTELQGNATGVGVSTDKTDVLGAYFTGGYNTLLLGTKSLKIFSAMLNEAVTKLGLGSAGNVLFLGIFTIISIMIIIGVLISAVVKRDL